jgi:hypothetical protein
MQLLQQAQLQAMPPAIIVVFAKEDGLGLLRAVDQFAEAEGTAIAIEQNETVLAGDGRSGGRCGGIRLLCAKGRQSECDENQNDPEGVREEGHQRPV